jgi:V8-like Glu-specific endopeptidase
MGRSSSLLIALTLALSLSTACGGAAPERDGESDERIGEIGESIVGGQNDADDPAVVAVVALGITLCSGALIGPRTVLTAGHCAFGDASKPEIHFGASSDQPDRVVKVVAKAVHPQFTTMGAPYDFGLLELETPVTDVAPLALRTTALSASDVGATIVRHVGYGVSDEASGGGVGTKRTVSYPITKVDDVIFYSGAPGKQTCTNDSGGPGFVRDPDGVERIAGVVSDGPNCHTDGWDGRADLAALASFVSDTRASWESSPPPASKGGCTLARDMRGDGDGNRLGAIFAVVFFCLGARRRHSRAVREASDLPKK